MGFLRKILGSSKGKDNTNDLKDQFEFSYRYDKEGFNQEIFNKGEEEHFEYEVNVTIEFLWDMDKNMYEVNYYVSSPTVADVDVPDDDQFVKDVCRDLKAKGINLDYIPHRFDWNMF